jgi:hypothetical protein
MKFDEYYFPIPTVVLLLSNVVGDNLYPRRSVKSCVKENSILNGIFLTEEFCT